MKFYCNTNIAFPFVEFLKVGYPKVYNLVDFRYNGDHSLYGFNDNNWKYFKV